MAGSSCVLDATLTTSPTACSSAHSSADLTTPTLSAPTSRPSAFSACGPPVQRGPDRTHADRDPLLGPSVRCYFTLPFRQETSTASAVVPQTACGGALGAPAIAHAMLA
jgi:hypothetical protein